MSSKKLSHISIIMDGNGRWANSKGMPRAYGHRAGIKSINKTLYNLNTINNISSNYKHEQKYYFNCARKDIVPIKKL